MKKPLLVVACGNLSRGDDALGPLLLDYIEQHETLTDIELVTDFQLQVEHALDIQQRTLVLFVDASVTHNDYFDFIELTAAKDHSFSSHALSPSAVLQVYQTVTNTPPPPSFLLGIKGFSFELGDDLSAAAEHNLQLACEFAAQLLKQPNPSAWRQKTT
ncbi:hydrogenase maturation protease [Methylomonas sp. AM2-LC]|uniref:hydrogenase maturation protease n=1 Tax=Methylomonas sp. AM2-LC TaxID=3153301 RepID=UPI0032661E5C